MDYLNSDIPGRRSVRLPSYDYTQPGAYFITIATQDRDPLFGRVVDGAAILGRYGEIARPCWQRIPAHFRGAHTDMFVIMPNHVHGIIVIDLGTVPIDRDAPTMSGILARLCGPVTEYFGRPTQHSLPTIVRSFKSAVTKQINELRHTASAPVWQRGYYEHVVRSDEELEEIREYIASNPAEWALDGDNPAISP
ncbi:MAG: transposase [Chloroflexi bacterium]|nr:transposase [Chloroflexota bacterium]